MENREHKENEFVCPVCNQNKTRVITVLLSIMSYLGDFENKTFDFHEVLYTEPVVSLCLECYKKNGIRNFKRNTENNSETTQTQNQQTN